MSLKDKETKELISEWVALDKQRKVNAKKANQIKASSGTGPGLHR